MSMQTGSVRSADESERSRQVDSVAWAVFFILIGAAMLAQIPWAWFLVALGVLVIGTQIVRWQLGLTVEAFWIACGVVFILGAAWDLLALPWPLVPVLLILLGAILLARTIWR
jgi:hypothetical protein